MTNSTYTLAWQDFRKRTFFFWALLLGWFPYGLLSSYLWNDVLQKPQDQMPYVLFPYATIWIAVGFWRSKFICPRCFNKFFVQGSLFFSFQNPFSKKCVHCGLNVGEDSEKSSVPKIRQKRTPQEKLLDFAYKGLLLFVSCFGMIVLMLTILDHYDPLMMKIMTKLSTLFSSLAIAFCLIYLNSVRTKGPAKMGAAALPVWLKISLPAFIFILFASLFYKFLWFSEVFEFPPSQDLFDPENLNPIWSSLAPVFAAVALLALYATQLLRESLKK